MYYCEIILDSRTEVWETCDRVVVHPNMVVVHNGPKAWTWPIHEVKEVFIENLEGEPVE